jgi:methylenetetrahydrofolate reductase (NADPH)
MLQPTFIDVTWGAAGITKTLSINISDYTQKYIGVDVLMHLSCSGLTKEEIRKILVLAKEMGIQNILALRGDPPRGALAWEPTPDGFEHAVDLVRFIKSEFGNYFGIAVAGFPEGYPQSTHTLAEEIIHLKEKVDAGADFILTQFFYDVSVFLAFMAQCREAEIRCPIIPGNTY